MDMDGGVFETAGPVTVYRPWPWRYRAACPCGWQVEGNGFVRGAALQHGIQCVRWVGVSHV